MSKFFKKLITTLLAASLMLAPVSVFAADEAALGLSIENIEETSEAALLEGDEASAEISSEAAEDSSEEEITADSLNAGSEEGEETVPLSTVESVEEAMNGVVQINTVFNDEKGNKYIVYGGTGILIGSEKKEYVVTNNHIVNPDWATRKAAYKYYKIPNKDDAWSKIQTYTEIVFENDVTVTCSVVNSSDNLDLCVLELSKPNLNRTPLTFLVQDRDEKKKPYSTTDSVYALGFPEGISYENNVFYSNDQVTMSSGKIANVTDYNGADLIQHNAQISVNNCGGPLLNDDGLVIGMNELTGDSNNYYSLDSTDITNILDSLGIEYTKMTKSQYDEWIHRNDVKEEQVVAPKPPVQIIRTEVQETNKVPKWIIIVLIALGVLVIGLIAGFAFIMIKQSKRKDSDDKDDKKKQKNAQQAPTIDRFGRPVSQTMTPAQKPNPQIQIQSNAGSFAKGTETTTLGAAPQGEGTTVLGGSSAPANANFLGTLIRRNNGENIVINKNDFTIGKDSLNIDFRIADNSAISRRHATIKQVGADIIIEDNFSTNGTFVNGARLAEGQAAPIKSGDVIMLANEEFDYRK